MKLLVGDEEFDVVIKKKRTNKNTYIRVKDDLRIYVTTSVFSTNKSIVDLLNNNSKSIDRMIQQQKKKQSNNTGFFYLGIRYDVVYVNYTDISFGEEKVFLNKDYDIDKWYKKQAKVIFKERLDYIYNKYTENIAYPNLRIRKMSTRWGVCNTKSKTVTLNLELIKRNIKYLDYVIVHELSHLIEANHSKRFWYLVEKNCYNYKEIRKEMKDF